MFSEMIAMNKLVKRAAWAAGLAAAVSIAPLQAWAAPDAKDAKDADRVERLTDLAMQAFPMHVIFEHVAAKDPKWPLKERADKVSDKQLACLRSELSTPAYRKVVRARAADYANANVSRLDGDLQVMNAGGSMLSGKLILLGVDAKEKGTDATPNEVLKGATGDQLSSFMSLVMDPKYRDLREVIGYGELFSGRKSSEESRKDGESLGVVTSMKLTLKAFSACDVPPSLIF